MNYQLLSMDELLLELDSVRMTMDRIQAEIKDRAKEELDKIEARKAELLAMTGQPKTVAVPVVKMRKSGQAKYQCPDNRNITWTGRGKKPVWMQSWIAKGKDPTDLLIAA